MLPGFEAAYRVGSEERAAFGKHWCGPEVFDHSKANLVAVYEPTHSDGQRVEIRISALPARFPELITADGYRIGFGSGHDYAFAIKIARAIAGGMMAIRKVG